MRALFAAVVVVCATRAVIAQTSDAQLHACMERARACMRQNDRPCVLRTLRACPSPRAQEVLRMLEHTSPRTERDAGADAADATVRTTRDQ